MTTIDKPLLRRLRVDIDAALAVVGQRHGLRLRTGGISFTPSTFTAKLEGAVLQEDGTVARKEAAHFASMAPMFGLEPNDLGATVVLQGRTFTIAGGLKPRSPRRPIVLDEGDGRTSVAPVEMVLYALGRTRLRESGRPDLEG